MSWPIAPSGTLTTVTTTYLASVVNALATWAGLSNASNYPLTNVAINETAGVTASGAALSIVSPALTGGATVTTAKGLQIAAQKVSGVTTAYAISQEGASDLNYFAGSVGIGTATPAYMLDVAGTFRALTTGGGGTSAANFDGDGSGDQLVIRGHSNTNQQLAVGYHTTGNYGVIQALFQGIAFEPLVLNPAGGFVGINTTAPTSPLQVVGLVTYASDALAGSGGLTSGALYKDSTGGLHVKL